MELNDEIVIQYLESKKIWLRKCIQKEILNYIDNRFDDAESIGEVYVRMKYKIEIRPVCQTCGNKVTFCYHKKSNTWNFAKHCSNHCAAIDPNTQKNKDKTKLERYGNPNYNNRDKYKQTCSEIYGDGVINVFQANSVKEKSKNTKYDRYGDPYYNNPEKVKQTNQKNLGVDYPLKSQVIRNKITENIINTYGVDNPAKSPIVKERTKETNNKIYGVDWAISSETVRQKIENTNIKKYGFKAASKAKIVKDKLSKVIRSEDVQRKSIETKKKNKSINTSKPEKYFYNVVLTYFPNAKNNFRTDKYKYNCDIYIPEIDLYIELNYFWTHGFHEFDENNLDDLKRLEHLQIEAKRHPDKNMYEAAINVWTIKDKEKIKTAKENNLNYIILWNNEDGLKWLEHELPKLANEYYNSFEKH